MGTTDGISKVNAQPYIYGSNLVAKTGKTQKTPIDIVGANKATNTNFTTEFDLNGLVKCLPAEIRYKEMTRIVNEQMGELGFPSFKVSPALVARVDEYFGKTIIPGMAPVLGNVDVAHVESSLRTLEPVLDAVHANALEARNNLT